MLDFDGYFVATEEAFVQEKEAMLDRVHDLRNSWDETVELDRQSAKLCSELQNLKGILSRAHLQILRSREEALRLSLQNAQRSFRVRQLQSEIWRFLPHTHESVESVDYQLGVIRTAPDEAPAPPMDPDEKLAKELSDLAAQWRDILMVQERVFAEELQHRQSDNEYFERFAADFHRQNADAHKSIDSMLHRLVKRIVHEKNASDSVATRRQDAIESADRRQRILTEKANDLCVNATQRTIAEREKIQQHAAIEANAVRDRIRNLERANLRRYAALQQRNTEVHRQHKAVLARVQGLRMQENRLLAQGTKVLEPAKERVFRLECELNALVSAVAAMKQCPDEQNMALLRMATAAVGQQARAAQSVEKVALEARNLSEQMGKLSREVI
jgi:hypothetical protein